MPDIDPQNTRGARKVNDVAGEMRVDQYLTNFSVSYRQDQANFVAGFASTPIPVMNESDKYAIYPAGYFWRDEAEVRPLGGRPVQVGYRVENGQYLAEEYGLEHTIDDRQRRNAAAPYNLDEAGTTLLESKIMIREERFWCQHFFKPGVWGFDFVGGGTDFTSFNDAASEPIAFIDGVKTSMARGTGKMPNTLVLGANVSAALRSNPDIVDRIKYTQRGVASLDVLASLFEVQNVKVARAVYNAAAEGADDDFEFIADDNAMWLGYIEPTPMLNAPTAVARFGWVGLYPGTNEMGGVIIRGRDDRARSDWIQDSNAFDYRQVSVDLGMFFQFANQPTSA
jgi:hypothetical protein